MRTMSHTPSVVRQAGKTAGNPFGNADKTIYVSFVIPSRDPLAFLFSGLMNAAFPTNELIGSILFK